MNWLTPGLALAVGAVAVPLLLVLYLLKLRRRDVEVSSTLLWRKAVQDMQANAPFQRLRRNILLLLQMLALLAAILALAQPRLAGDGLEGTRHVILIDRSRSMATADETLRDGRPATRLEKAKEDALRLIESLRQPDLLDRTRGREGDTAMVIAFDVSARAIQSFTSDRALLRAAVESIAQTDAPSRADEAFRLVRAQAPRRLVRDDREGSTAMLDLPPPGVGTIHLFTDGRLPDLPRVEVSPEDRFVFHRAGKTQTPNAAITALQAGRALDDPDRLSLFVGVQSTETLPRTMELELQIDGEPVQIRSITLPAAQGVPAPGTGGTQSPAPAPRITPALGGLALDFNRPRGGIIGVRLRSPQTDLLKADDSAWIVAPPSRLLSVAVVTRGSVFLRDALAGLPLARLEQLTPEAFAEHQARVAAQRAEPFDVVVLDGVLPQAAAGSPAAEPTAALPAGRWILLGALPGGPEGLRDEGPGEPTVFLDWTRTHPALRGVTFDAVVVAKPRRVTIPSGASATAIAATDAGPAIVELTSAAARALVVTFDPAESSWPLDVSFVLFMAQAVEYLGRDATGVSPSIEPGGVLSDRIPPTASDVRVRTPEGVIEPVGQPGPDGRVVFGPVSRAGVYQLSWVGPPGPTDATVDTRSVRPFTANLLDAAESDVAAAVALELPTTVAAAQAEEARRAESPLWPWLVLGMLALLLLEWYVYNRKVHL